MGEHDGKKEVKVVPGLIYLYGLIPVEEAGIKSLPALKGLDGESEVRPLPLKNSVALICQLDEQAYTEESIKDKANHDMEWLQEKAFHHHETLLSLYKRFTVIPMKFCTIFSNKESLSETLLKNEEKLSRLFMAIKEKEEWNLKIYSDDDRLKQRVLNQNPLILKKKEKIGGLSPGRQYFEKIKMEKMIEQELEREKDAACKEIHEKLTRFSLLDQVKRNWRKEVTGRDESMNWNSVYLVKGSKTDEFLEEINRIKEKFSSAGWTFEATGPWPAYHFASLN